MKQYIISIIISILYLSNIYAEEKIIIEQWRNMPIDELMQRGRDYANLTDSKDSALACFRMVSMRYSPKMTLEEKNLCARALSNCGMLYTLNYYDYQQAYKYLNQSLILCEENNLESVYPCVYINMGNLYAHYNRLINSESAARKSKLLYEKGLKTSLQCKDWSGVVSSCINLCNTQNLISNVSTLKQDTSLINIIFSDIIPEGTPSLAYARHLTKVSQLLVNGQYADARRLIQEDSENEGRIYNSVRHSLTRGMTMAESYQMEGKTDSCIFCLDSTLTSAEKYQQLDAQVMILYKLATICSEIGDSLRAHQYYFRYYQEKENLTHQSGLDGIIETDLLNQIEDEELRIKQLALERERHRLWLMLLILVIIIILGTTQIVVYKNRQLMARNRALYQKTQELMQVEQNERDLRRTLPAAEVVDNLTIQIQRVMDDPEIFCQQDFTMARLAEMVNSNTTYISKIINQTYNKSFPLLLSDCRVKEACSRLADQEHYGHLTIEAISESVGFKSRTTFLTAFKRSIGLSPSEYQKLSHEKHPS